LITHSYDEVLQHVFPIPEPFSDKNMMFIQLLRRRRSSDKPLSDVIWQYVQLDSQLDTTMPGYFLQYENVELQAEVNRRKQEAIKWVGGLYRQTT
jgi:hypothetical protein